LKIGLVEVCSKNHYVLVEAWVKVLNDLKIEPVLYITEEVNDLLDKNINVIKIIKNDDESMKHFLKKISDSDDVSHLIITSLQSHLIDFYLYFKPKVNFSLTIHNSKTWFVGNELKSIKNIVKKMIRSRFLKQAKNFFVSSENMRNFVVDLDRTKKNIFLMPFMIFSQNELKSTSKDKITKIVYPGIISSTRKKYDLFFQLAKSYPEIEFVLLGAPSKNLKEGSNEIIKKVKELNYKNIKYFERYLTDEEYSEEFKTADFIFSELKLDFEKEDYKEIYGITKDTGISYLMIKHSLPLIVNKDFNNLKSLNPATLYFNTDEEIKGYINKYNSNDEYNRLLSKTFTLTSNFSSSKIATALQNQGFINEIQ
jgi:hypothetical protein